MGFSLCYKSPDSASFNILFSKDPQMFLPDMVHFTSSCWEMKAAVNASGALSKSCIDFRCHIAIPLSDMWEQVLPIHLSQVLFLVWILPPAFLRPTQTSAVHNHMYVVNIKCLQNECKKLYRILWKATISYPFSGCSNAPTSLSLEITSLLHS